MRYWKAGIFFLIAFLRRTHAQHGKYRRLYAQSAAVPGSDLFVFVRKGHVPV